MLGGKFKRQSTGEWLWDKASAVAAGWQTVGAWPSDGPESEPDPAPDSIPDPPPARTDSLRCDRGLSSQMPEPRHQAAHPGQIQNVHQSTRGLLHEPRVPLYRPAGGPRHGPLLRRLERRQEGKGQKARTAQELCPVLRETEMAGRRHCQDLEAPPKASELNPKTPFEDEELERIYAACDKIGAPTKPGPGYRTWGGVDAKDFILLSCYTGLRISDVATFNISKRLNGNDVFLYMHKTGEPLYTWIPDWLVDRLRAREKVKGPLIFICGETGNAKQLCDIWRNKRLKLVFKLAGPFEEKPTPHRFRHTFARILLENGVEEPEVAELIGDTVEVVRKHCSNG